MNWQETYYAIATVSAVSAIVMVAAALAFVGILALIDKWWK